MYLSSTKIHSVCDHDSVNMKQFLLIRFFQSNYKAAKNVIISLNVSLNLNKSE